MSYKYDIPEAAYKVAKRRIKEAKGSFFRKELTELNLGGLGLTAVPPEISQLSGLKKLWLTNNQLITIPSEIGQLSNLILLHLSGNLLTAIPPEITRLTNLIVLHLSENKLTAIPPEIGQLTNLRVLNLDQNQLTTISPKIGQLSNLSGLHLRQSWLTTVPAEIGQLSNLKVLDLGDNRLTAIPAEIGQLSNLDTLCLDGNRLKTVPAEFAQLVNLMKLDLRGNPSLLIPPEIVKHPKSILVYLQAITKVKNRSTTILDLRRLGLYTFPPEITKLNTLTEIDLRNNWLKAIPSEIAQLLNLTHLLLSDNQLTAIPPEVSQLVNLTELHLDNNKLTDVPTEIALLRQLKWLFLDGNPDLPIPPEIVAQANNAQAILDYVREQQQEVSFRPLNEAKLILVGQGGVGKTSLAKRLVGDQFDPHEDQTKGIRIGKWQLNVPRPEQGTVAIALNIWDFGGQEIMHATHQFFLTRRSLYLLVLDARQGEEEGRVEYWLSLINSFAPDAPILIIINKIDQQRLDVDRRGLQKKYPAIRGFIPTSARDEIGIDELKTAIINTLAAMPDVDSPFPASWMRVKEALTVMQAARNFIPYAGYEQLCRENGVDETSSQETLIRFLHDLGIALNFQDDDRVRETSVLNPNWVTRGVYALLNSPILQEAHGILRRNQLRRILPTEEYPAAQRHFLLEMMLKFELAFEMPDQQSLLIPDLLSKEEPAFEWDDANALQFAYQYHVLPRSILHRFMVRQYSLVDPAVRWRTGVLLRYEGLSALVNADIEAKTIRIAINGEGNRRQFLYSLRLVFAGIHESVAGTKPQEVVLIPGYPSVPSVSYNYLEKLAWFKTMNEHLYN